MENKARQTNAFYERGVTEEVFQQVVQGDPDKTGICRSFNTNVKEKNVDL